MNQTQPGNKPLRQSVSLIIVGVAILSSLADPLSAQPTPHPAKITFDRYYTVKIRGQHCGYARTAIRQSASQMTTLNYINMTVTLMGQDVHLIIRTLSHEKPSGELISMEIATVTNGAQTRKKATVQGDQLLVTTELWGRQATERFSIPPGGFTTEIGADRLIMPLLDQPGKRLELTILSLEGGPTPFLPIVMEVVGPETIQAYSQAVSAVKIKNTITLLGAKLTSNNWLDQQGSLASHVSFGGLDIFLQAAEKAHAKKKTGKADLTNIALIVPKVSLKRPDQTVRAVYRLTFENDKPLSIELPRTDMQRVINKGADYLDVEVTRQTPQQSATPAAGQIPPELAEYLQSSLYLDWQDPAVMAAAEKVDVASQDPWDLAQALWIHVNQTISNKTLGVYFDPASRILASRRGDCTEHAVLLAALARARGLPSRIVTGLVQVSGLPSQPTVFGYHAWTEVWIDGKWISLDAALNQAPADVSHIALGVSALNSSEPTADTAVGILQLVGNLKIDVLEQK